MDNLRRISIRDEFWSLFRRMVAIKFWWIASRCYWSRQVVVLTELRYEVMSLPYHYFDTHTSAIQWIKCYWISMGRGRLFKTRGGVVRGWELVVQERMYSSLRMVVIEIENDSSDLDPNFNMAWCAERNTDISGNFKKLSQRISTSLLDGECYGASFLGNLKKTDHITVRLNWTDL